MDSLVAQYESVTSTSLLDKYAFVPAHPHAIAYLTANFLHGGWLHIIGNMWFLWLFGNNVEDSMGRGRFIVFYLLCGLAAAAAQVMSQPESAVPMVGASGAISGVMGAYIVLYPRVRVYTLVPLFIIFTTIALPAWVILGYWMLLQVAGGLSGQEGGVAFWAHIGGFIAGVVLVKWFARPEYIREHRARHWRHSAQPAAPRTACPCANRGSQANPPTSS